jgi:hypothetical protein
LSAPNYAKKEKKNSLTRSLKKTTKTNEKWVKPCTLSAICTMAIENSKKMQIWVQQKLSFDKEEVLILSLW